jgi:hypothetical protein
MNYNMRNWAEAAARVARLHAQLEEAHSNSYYDLNDTERKLADALEKRETASRALLAEDAPAEKWKAEVIAQVHEAVTAAVGVLAHEVADLKLRVALLEKAKP